MATVAATDCLRHDLHENQGYKAYLSRVSTHAKTHDQAACSDPFQFLFMCIATMEIDMWIGPPVAFPSSLT